MKLEKDKNGLLGPIGCRPRFADEPSVFDRIREALSSAGKDEPSRNPRVRKGRSLGAAKEAGAACP